MATDTKTTRPLPVIGPRQSFGILDHDVPDVVKPLVEVIHEGKSEKVGGIISEIISKNKQGDLQTVFVEQETILHRAVKMRASKDIVSALLIACPNLITESRSDSDLYRGQTALHIAVTGEDIEVTEEILKKAKNIRVIDEIQTRCAIGSRFENTVMLGEIPVIVAALTLNVKLFDKLLEHGAKIDATNSRGDNVCHCLIRYAHLYPEKLADIMVMIEHISGSPNKSIPEMANKTSNAAGSKTCSNVPSRERSHVWVMGNNDGLNPLKLAAKLGQQLIFKFIMEMKGVYCFVNYEDGLFDVELYDVTDIDPISDFKLVDIIQWFDPTISETTSSYTKQQKNAHASQCKVPTLEMIFDSDSATVFKFIEMSPLRYVINRKWEFYRWFFAFWGILHILYTIGYTVYAVRRSAVATNGTSSKRSVNRIGQDGYVTFYAILSLVFATLYILQEIIRIIKGHMPWTLSHIMNCYHNGPFRLVLVLYGVTVLADLIWRIADKQYGDYFLVCSMILGWWFLVFFLRGFRQFSFFTVMIQKVLVGDMFRFSIIIGMELLAFTTGIYIVFRGTPTFANDVPENENVYEYSKLLIAMFKMMFGFTSLDVLFEAPSPWFAVCIYVAFVLLTYVLMINSLIAMMSNTCSFVSQNRDIQYRVQQLSIILFFESIFPSCLLRMVGQSRVCEWYDADTKQIVKRSRSFMEVRSLHEVTKSRSRHRPNTETMLETIFHTIKNIQLPSIGVMEEENPESRGSGHKPVAVRRSNLETTPGVNSDDNEANGKPFENQERQSRRKHKKKKRTRNTDETIQYPPVDKTNAVNSIGVESAVGSEGHPEMTDEKDKYHQSSQASHRLTSVEQI